MAEDKNKLATPVTFDMSLDDIEDLPAFLVFPGGTYRMRMKEGIEQKEINEHPAAQAQLTMMEVLEVTETLKENEAPPKEGDETTLSWMLDNKWGAGGFKEFLKPIGAHLGKANVAEIVKETKGMDIIIVLKRTFDKDKDRHYQKLVSLAVL